MKEAKNIIVEDYYSKIFFAKTKTFSVCWNQTLQLIEYGSYRDKDPKP